MARCRDAPLPTRVRDMGTDAARLRLHRKVDVARAVGQNSQPSRISPMADSNSATKVQSGIPGAVYQLARAIAADAVRLIIP